MNNKFDVSVVGGAGHIGLPLSLFLSSFGHDVTIIDTNKVNRSGKVRRAKL